jgi:hypothetical protein
MTGADQTLGCPDRCAACGVAVKSFANLDIVRDEKHLAPRYMPPGGCTCQSMVADPECRRCFPRRLLCQACGDRESAA